VGFGPTSVPFKAQGVAFASPKACDLIRYNGFRSRGINPLSRTDSLVKDRYRLGYFRALDDA
jgi:hypothetical protein